MRRATSDKIWVLAADHMMAKALELGRWVDVFAAHGVRIEPQVVTDLRLVASSDGLSILDAEGMPVAPPRLCLVRTYEQRMNELKTFENNMGFLTANTKSGNSLVKEMERRIDSLKEEIAGLEQRIKELDNN